METIPNIKNTNNYKTKKRDKARIIRERCSTSTA